MELIGKINKKAEEKSIWKPMSLILVILVVAAVFILLWRFGLKEKLENLFPDFEKEQIIKQMQDEQNNIPAQEKERDYGNRYPIIRLHYTEGVDDLFAFRWNSNLSEKKGEVQVVMNIGQATIAFGIPTSYISQEWLINPNYFEENKVLIFKEGKGLYDYEKDDVMKIMNSKSEDEMIKKIAEAEERWKLNKKEVYIEFPAYNKDAISFFPEIEQFSNLNEEQLKAELKKAYSWYYEENKEGIKNE